MNPPVKNHFADLLRHTLDFCGDCLSRQDYPAALEALNRARTLAPADPQILSQRGQLHLLLQNHQSARSDFEAALKLEPGLTAARAGLTECARPQVELPALPLPGRATFRPAPATGDPRPSTPRPAASPADSEIRRLAKYVGDDWKQQTYYDDAEQYMEKQWQETIWPFIQEANFDCVLDLAAGHGRNSEKLRTLSKNILLVDINQENIDFCRNRFAGDDRFTFIRNDGCSLEAIGSNAVSLVYCFDAMVHFDSDVVRAYLREFYRILRPGGLGFCHHSNYTSNPGGNVHESPGWRNFMSEALFAHWCAKENLRVVKSRVIDWTGPKSDCVTLFRK